MSETLTALWNQLVYLFTNLTLINVLDILLLALFFFVIFQALYQTRALQVLRGTLIIAVLGIALFLLIPLETVRLLVQGLLIAGIIALPILFQDELRRWLTGLGQIGIRRENGSAFVRFEDTILTAVEQLSTRRHGALIVLEGTTPLDDIIETGIALDAQQVTSELLTTIFYPNTPLHDGAVVLRGDRLMAASCILPMQKEQTESAHLGTRHRAALGLTFQVPDAIVIIVSEETGSISVSQAGRIYRGLSASELHDWLDRFRLQSEIRPIIHWGWLRTGGPKIILANIIVALALSLVAWVSVTIQTNPPLTINLTDVPLNVIPPSPDVVLISTLPETVAVEVQAPEDRIEVLTLDNITAQVDLSELSSGSYQVPVEVAITDERVQIVSIAPPAVSIILENYVQRELEVFIEILGDNLLPLGYDLGEYSATPEYVSIQGADSVVAQVAQAKTAVDVSGRTEDFQVVTPIDLLDQEGDIDDDLVPSPQQVVIDVIIIQTFSTREIAVQAVWDASTLDTDYTITGAVVNPSVVTLTGQQWALEAASDYLQTATIDLTNIRSDLSEQVPLIIPEGVTAIDKDGNRLLNVFVTITIEPVTDYYSERRRVELRGLDPNLTARVSDSWVSILLFGPKPVLREIESDPSLLNVYADLSDLQTPGTYTVILQYEAPEDITAEVFPPEIEVVISAVP
ncbi:MAG: diadenylate cyclase CdaA [Chloroflexota bacterium]|nr:diadenylate cyclase CdaA [Chloroflexota bacterium]